jgi:hypothetical protein
MWDAGYRIIFYPYRCGTQVARCAGHKLKRLQSDVRSVQISGNSTTSSILRR